jgi:MFS family permease
MGGLLLRMRSPAFPIICALLAAEFTSAFELVMIFSAMKQLIVHFGSPLRVGWMITGYLLVSAAAAAICGRLGDLYGRRRVLMIMLSCALVGSIISALSTSIWMVIVGRSVQGFAGAILPLCYGLVREHIRKERVPFGIAIIAYAVLLASGAGGVFGGLIVDNIGWRGIFIASASMAVVSLGFCALFLPPSKRQPPQGRIDIWGGLLFVPALACLLLAVTSVGAFGWTSPFVLVLAVVGVVLMTVWARHELSTPEPLINLRLMAKRNVILANVAIICYAMGPIQGQVIPLLAQQPRDTGIGLGLSATFSAMISLPSQITALFFPPIAAWATTRFGTKPVIMAAGLFGFLSMFSLLVNHGTFFSLMLVHAFISSTSTCIYASVPNLVVAATPEERTSEATGMLQVSRSVGGAVGSQILASALAFAVVRDPKTGAGPFPAPSAYLLAMSLMLLASCGIGVAALLVRRVRPVPSLVPQFPGAAATTEAAGV